ncbi:CapA family protein [Mesorhizobium marinum]|uniref:CapA family protein n=1 Tax=Mesorhizobium marinum TaxID=3228790 RepID=UPI00346639B5
MPKAGPSIFLGGDAMLTEPWSEIDDPAFLRLVAEMRAADVTVVNLETVIHQQTGYAQPECGGTYMVSPPAIATELKWAGIDMLACANNHAFDYGSAGVLETLEHVAEAGLALAGTGRDLQAARSPAFFGSDAGTVGLVSMASTFVPYGRASASRPDMHGRPGLNPLRPTKRIAATLPASVAARLPGRFGRQLAQGRTARFFGLRVLAADQARLDLFRHTVLPADLEANLEAIGSAAAQADVTIASIHAHIQRSWLRRFAHRAIERGADVVFVQGPHEVRAIEFHAGKPIFYSLGDFVYQPHRITRFPSEMYEALGLGPEATVRDLWPIWERGTGLGSKRKTFEAVAAVLQFDGRRIERIRLLPLDLQFDADAEIRGRPRLADPRLGRKIIEEIAALSRRRGTIVRYDAALNEGILEPA